MDILRQYIRESLEIDAINPVSESQIFCDMDGVLVNFEAAVVDLVNQILDTGEIPGIASTKGHRKRLGWVRRELGSDWRASGRPDLDLKPVRTMMFSAIGANPGPVFASMPPWPDALRELWPFITSSGHVVNILSAPIRAHKGASMTAGEGKTLWVEKWLTPQPAEIIITPAVQKVEYATTNGIPNILIDDRKSTIDSWNAAGGIGIFHTPGGSAETISRLRELGI